MSKGSFEQRLGTTNNPLLKKLFKVIIDKQSNLCVAADFGSIPELLRFIDICGPHICMLKTHTIMMLKKESLYDVLEQIYAKKKEFNFIWFEDEKFNEVPEILKRQYQTFVNFVDLVTIDPLAGDHSYNAIREAIEEAALPVDEPRGCFPLVELSYSSPGTRPPGEELLKGALAFRDICVGVISQSLQIPEDLVKATPGVHLSKTGDSKGQNYKTPHDVIKRGTDIIIVGRGITAAPESEWLAMTIKYKESAWQAYQAQVVPQNDL